MPTNTDTVVVRCACTCRSFCVAKEREEEGGVGPWVGGGVGE